MHQPNSRLRHRVLPVGAIITSAMVLSACVTNVEEGNPEGWEAIVPAEVPEISALVPDEIAARGELTMGTNPPFAPFEFKDSDGSIIGMEVDLARAAAGVLGLELRPVEQDFAMILPAVSASTLDFGGSGFTDTEERRENYDFINFLYAGVQWAQQPGDNIDPDNACGLSVAVQRTTVSETDDVRPKSEDCIAQGKEPIEVLSYDSSDTAATALVLGRADAFSADSPITAWAVERSEGRMELTGEMFQAAPYGYAFTKNSELGYAFAQALQYLIESGDYADVLAQWNIEEGLLDQALINEAPIPAATDYLNP
nr:ABC transporter substrate-binding protein [Corynebacterium occultum]